MGAATGVYTSGFHEEFELAKTRRESTGEPEIWLVFKTPRSDKIEDPGSELTKYWNFVRCKDHYTKFCLKR